MTAAARALGVSQPTLGRRLKDLEGTLAARIFERYPNHIAPTPFGMRLLDHARAMESAALEVSRLSEIRRAEGDPVRISATTSVATFLSDRLSRLTELARSPGVRVAVSTTRHTVDLARREADIALRMRAVPEAGRLRSRRIGRLSFTVYGLAGASPSTPPRYVGLTNDRPPPQRPWLDAHAAAMGGTIGHRLGEFFMRHQAILNGEGASLLPCFVGDADTALVRLVDPPAELDEDVYLLTHEDAETAPAIPRVADALRTLFRESDALLTGRREILP